MPVLSQGIGASSLNKAFAAGSPKSTLWDFCDSQDDLYTEAETSEDTAGGQTIREKSSAPNPKRLEVTTGFGEVSGGQDARSASRGVPCLCCFQ